MVKQKIMLLVTTLMISSVSAETVYLNGGDTAPYPGYLIDDELMLEFRRNEEKLITYEKLRHNDEVIKEKKDETINSLKEEYKHVTTKSSYEKYLYFVAGILITGLTVKITK